MAIDKAAVREGTRWVFLCREVEVHEVSEAFVIFSAPNGLVEVALLPKFLAGAHDPATFEHEHLLDIFGSWGPGMLPPEPQHISQAVSYLLARLGPPAPTNITPPAFAPKPAPVVVEPLKTAEEIGILSEPEPQPATEYCIAMPDVPDDEPERLAPSRRRHPKHDWRA